MKPYPFCKKTLWVALTVISVGTLTSCLKNIPPILKGGGGKSDNPVVLVAGLETPPNALTQAEYWVNGQKVIVSDGTRQAEAQSIFAKGNDVYVAGQDQGAVYWKNNTEVRLPAIPPNLDYNSFAYSVYVSGNDVYVAGVQGGDVTRYERFAAYWKNGSEVILDSSPQGWASSIFVSGNDVYVCGMIGSNAVFWKNGVKVYLTSIPDLTGNASARASSIFVSGTDVYVAGAIDNFDGSDGGARCWKNAVALPLNNSTASSANSVFVAGKDVYVAGTSSSGAVYWKNGADKILAAPGNASAIYVSGKDVYVAGNAGTDAVYWKNDAEVTLGANAFPTSIFVK